METISIAFVRAIAAKVGVIYDSYGIDYGLDGFFTKAIYDERYREWRQIGVGVDIQLKSTTQDLVEENGFIKYDLEAKNYRDLIYTGTGRPRILILYSMPRNNDEWVMVNSDFTKFQKCAWWYSLKGLPNSDNEVSVRIKIPVLQRLTCDSLKELCERAEAGISI